MQDKNTQTQEGGKMVLLTGMAGFIGFHLTGKLKAKGYNVVGIDNINDYYDPRLKKDRLVELGFDPEDVNGLRNNSVISSGSQSELKFYKTDLTDTAKINEIFQEEKPDYVVHLAAQAGVRYSLENPHAYLQSNITGFLNILENCRNHPVKHMAYASSSSVYGSNEKMPFSVHHNVDHPISLYAATKKSSELMAHTYSHLFGVPTTGLRFFTVYGPWGRPDMATFIFTKKIVEDVPIEVFNHGNMKRDFTYIDDIVEGVYRVMLKVPEPNEDWDGMAPDPASSRAPYRIFNIGNHQPVNLKTFIQIIEEKIEKKANINYLPMQKGDVPATYADIEALQNYIGFKPETPIETGVARFVNWYKDYYKIQI
jgi:UDP-glucuronate 4-epimerase